MTFLQDLQGLQRGSLPGTDTSSSTVAVQRTLQSNSTALDGNSDCGLWKAMCCRETNQIHTICAAFPLWTLQPSEKLLQWLVDVSGIHWVVGHLQELCHSTGGILLNF